MMSNVWTLVAVMIYLGGALGPDGVMTGKVAETALLLAVVSQAGFAIIGWFERRKAIRALGQGLE